MAENKALSAVPTPESEELTADEKLHKLLFYGDISRFNDTQKNEYLFQLCRSLGLNPWTKPFDMIPTDKGVVVYANKGAGAQLRDLKAISVTKAYAGLLRLGNGAVDESIYEVEFEAEMADPRAPGGIRRGVGVATVPIGFGKDTRLMGDALATAIMKCWTKAERRVTLAISGLGFMDATEVDSMISDRKDTPAAPQRRAPRALPTTVRSEPEAAPPPPASVAVVGGEKVNTATGEVITDAEVVGFGRTETPAAPPAPAPPPPPPPAAQAAPQPLPSNLPSPTRFPPAVAPVVKR